MDRYCILAIGPQGSGGGELVKGLELRYGI